MQVLYCKNCNSIIYSLARHHYNTCECCNCSIDDKGNRIIYKNLDDFMVLKLNKIFMLENLLEKAHNNGGTLNIKLGVFKLYPTSNIGFYKKLIYNFDEFRCEWDKVVLNDLEQNVKIIGGI